MLEAKGKAEALYYITLEVRHDYDIFIYIYVYMYMCLYMYMYIYLFIFFLRRMTKKMCATIVHLYVRLLCVMSR